MVATQDLVKIRRGLDLPINGQPRQVLHDGPQVHRVALLGDDYVGMKPTMEVAIGDRVRRGDMLFSDKKIQGVRYTSPAAGRVAEINRGEKRRFLSVVIEVDGDESAQFSSHPVEELYRLTPERVREILLESGLWTSLRQRPYSKVASPEDKPSSIFVTAIDTHPLAPDPSIVIHARSEHWQAGLRVLSQLGFPMHLCKGPHTNFPLGDDGKIQTTSFEGPHPAGLAGTHIHFLDPVHSQKIVWQIGYQDVIAIGELFLTGRYPADRVIALGGPRVLAPRLVRTVLGASTSDLTRGQLDAGTNRVISGSVLGGRTAEGPVAFVGRYHHQVSVLEEGDQREFLGWQKPGFNKFSLRRIFASTPQVLAGQKRFDMNTNTNGSERAMVPIGMYEDVMPLDIIPTYLLRSLIVKDTDQAQALGCLELDEEDLALCTFVCPGKYEYGPILRDNLTLIEREG